MSVTIEAPAISVATVITPEEIDPADYLPHRGTYLLITRVTAYAKATLEAEYQITKRPHWARDHFPECPMMPATLALEIAEQALALHVLIHMRPSRRRQSLPVLAEIREWKPSSRIRPGELLTIRVERLFDIDPTSLTRHFGRVSVFRPGNVLAGTGIIEGQAMPRAVVLSHD